MTRVLIFGGIAAGMKAAATARRRQPDLDILILRDFSPFMRQSTTRPTSNAISIRQARTEPLERDCIRSNRTHVTGANFRAEGESESAKCDSSSHGEFRVKGPFQTGVILFPAMCEC